MIMSWGKTYYISPNTPLFFYSSIILSFTELCWGAGMHGSGHVRQEGACMAGRGLCMAGGCAWQGACMVHACPPTHPSPPADTTRYGQ